MKPIESPLRVPFNGKGSLAKAPTAYPDDHPFMSKRKKQLAAAVERISDQQRRLAAEERQALLIVFQGMDAAGKDSTIRAALTGVNPAGVRVHGFRAPSTLERSHDFLWRLNQRLPKKGSIGVFNRSHYEEVVTVRVHPEYLERQNLPEGPSLDERMKARFDSIRDWEARIARSGTTILKFFLHVGREEQRNRLLARLDDPRKHWKFEAADLDARDRWDEYQSAYEKAITATSRRYAPWYVIPADDKPAMRVTVADLIARALERMSPQYPEVSEEQVARLAASRARLLADD